MCKVMKFSPSEVSSMPVAKMEFFMERLGEDIKNKDLFIVPSPKINL